MRSARDSIKDYAKEQGITIIEADRVVKSVLDLIVRDIQEHGGFSYINNFTISKVYRNPRLGRNPLTGEEYPIPATYDIRIKAGKKLRKSLNS